MEVKTKLVKRYGTARSLLVAINVGNALNLPERIITLGSLFVTSHVNCTFFLGR